MTRLYLSKFVRMVNNKPFPKICFASEYIPQSLNDICDCKHFCKYGPKGIHIIKTDVNTLNNDYVIRQ